VPRTGELRAEIGELRDELRKLGRFGHILGSSTPMQKLYDQLGRVAPTSATVLLVEDDAKIVGQAFQPTDIAADRRNEISLHFIERAGLLTQQDADEHLQRVGRPAHIMNRDTRQFRSEHTQRFLVAWFELIVFTRGLRGRHAALSSLSEPP
jgi:hypothetical protein